MKKKLSIFGLFPLVIALMVISACAPTMVSVSQPPDYYPPAAPIPITLGISTDDTASGVFMWGKSQIRQPYGPAVIEELKRMRVFKDIVYPVGDNSVDAMLFLTMKGNWAMNNRGRAIASFLIGTPNYEDVEGITNVGVKLVKGNKIIIDQTLVIDTKGQYTGSDTDSISSQLNAVQIKKIAIALSDLLQNKQNQIMSLK